MILMPAIDLKNGKCVRLKYGLAENQTIYSDDPLAMAQHWVSLGSTRLHVIDLDGAFTGEPQNLEIVVSIKKETNVFVQMGGGIRSIQTMDKILKHGIDRIILGTVVFQDSRLAEDAFKKFRNKIIVAMDVKDGFIAIKGWKDSSGLSIDEGLKRIEQWGCQEVIYTDIGRDGTLEGVNLRGIQEVMNKTNMTIYASGGVSSIEDIKNLKKINSPGCVVGKALYDNRMNLKDAFQVCAA